MKKFQRLSAFTLIEVLVTLTIIGILLTFVVPMVMDRPDQARMLKIKSDSEAVAAAMTLYRLDHGDYPASGEEWQSLVAEGNGTGYLHQIPVDPWNNEYIMRSESGKHQLLSMGKDGKTQGSFAEDDVVTDLFK